MNPYLETLKEELREECGEDICQADWWCFFDALVDVDNFAWQCPKGSDEFAIEGWAIQSAAYAQGTRADLPSIVKYAYAAIEENLK